MNKEIISNYAVQLGDSSNILSHRLAEMYASGPTLEECIALTNISLDHLGQATSFYEYAAKLDNDGKTADDIAYRRNERQYFNHQLVEQPNVNFAHVMLRQFFVDSFNIHYYAALCNSSDEMIAAIAAKGIKEVRYHRQHSSQWLLRLGKGTKVSHDKLKDAMIHLWPYTNEYFISDANEKSLVEATIAPDLAKIKELWSNDVEAMLQEINLEIPSSGHKAQGGKEGKHTEHLGHIISEMQYLPRAYPDAKW